MMNKGTNVELIHPLKHVVNYRKLAKFLFSVCLSFSDRQVCRRATAVKVQEQ